MTNRVMHGGRPKGRLNKGGIYDDSRFLVEGGTRRKASIRRFIKWGS